MCQPASFDMEVYNRRNEEFTVQKIKTCKLVKRHCQQESRRCQRISKILHFFPNSKYQTRVDVGECIGGCDGDGELHNRNNTSDILAIQDVWLRQAS